MMLLIRIIEIKLRKIWKYYALSHMPRNESYTRTHNTETWKYKLQAKFQSSDNDDEFFQGFSDELFTNENTSLFR